MSTPLIGVITSDRYSESSTSILPERHILAEFPDLEMNCGSSILLRRMI